MFSALEDFIYKHGAYWALALVAVALSKLYTDEEQSVKKILSSVILALAVSFMGVEVWEAKVTSGTLFVYVFVGSFLVDVIAVVLLSVRKKLMNDPELIIKWVMRGRGK